MLLNGRRVVPTSGTGAVDINGIPNALLARVDVVTGGASADWGSNAIAGVVNLIYDTNFTGLKLEAQYGVSDVGDNENTHVGFGAGGDIARGRGHVLVGGEYEESRGILSQADRAWGRQERGLVFQSTLPTRLIASDVGLLAGTLGGMTTGTRAGTVQFGPGGTVLPYAFGSVLGQTTQVGGDGYAFGQAAALSVPYKRYNGAVSFGYDLFDGVRLTLEGNLAHAEGKNATTPPFFLPATIRAGNPYIPASVAATLAATNTATFPLYRIAPDLGAITAQNAETVYRGAAALDGRFGQGWTWDAYVQYGRADLDLKELNNPVAALFNNALDAVTSPTTGQPVCRVSTTTSTVADPFNSVANCAPLNLFGQGSPSQAAIAYVNRTAELTSTLTQLVAAGTIRGDLFRLPAGPVSVAFGPEFRRETYAVNADALSNASAFSIVNVGKTVPQQEQQFKEVFGEAAIPLLKNQPFARAADLNVAVRYTDFERGGVSQDAVTYKFGLVYTPVADITGRASFSHDFRAPNVNELYAPVSISPSTLIDTRTNRTAVTPVQFAGNPALGPESSNTTLAGFVVRPRVLPGFEASADFYKIRITQAIATTDAQSIVTRCNNGDTALCALITRDATTGFITQVTRAPVNIGRVSTSGIDFQVSYRHAAPSILSADRAFLTGRIVGNYVMRYGEASTGTTVVQRAGEVGNPGTADVPKVRLFGTLDFQQGPFGMQLESRYVGEAKFDNTFNEGVQINRNHVGSVVYFDLSGRYDLKLGSYNLQLFAGVRNLLDRDPPVVPSTFVLPLGTNPYIYDTVGRYMYFGIRARL